MLKACGRNLFLMFLLLSSLTAHAALQIPKNLTQSDRIKVTEILGLSTAVKVLGNPYPLGGYSGVELGFGFEVVGTKEISNLGSSTSTQSETNYSLLSIGKGIYNNVDIMIQFSPFTQTEAVTNFGGQIRWGFFQAQSLPLHLSVMSSLNSVNFQDKITMLSQGNDLVAGFSVQDITLYMGGGLVRTIATFQGAETCTTVVPPALPVCTKNNDSVTDSGKTIKEDVVQSHYLAGVNLRMDKLFFAMQMDRYTQSVFSAKLGIRF